MKILHIDSSIQGDASVSRDISSAMVDRLRSGDPLATITYRDLAADPLPHLDLDQMAVMSAHPVLREFLEADVVVIGAPMYNFGISSQLKAWIDRIVVAGQTFKYGPEGVTGLATGKHVFVAHSRGGLYGEAPSQANEHAESHLRAILGFIGIADPEFIVAEGVAYGQNEREAALAAAHQKIAGLPLADLLTAA